MEVTKELIMRITEIYDDMCEESQNYCMFPPEWCGCNTDAFYGELLRRYNEKYNV